LVATIITLAGATPAAGAVPHGNLLGNPGAEEAGTLPWVRGGCPSRMRTVKLRRNQRKRTLAHPLGEAKLARGTRFTVTITRKGTIGTVARYTMRVKRFPARTDRCLPPGAKHPARCAA
jgi:hypothetical protein